MKYTTLKPSKIAYNTIIAYILLYHIIYFYDK